MCQFLYNYIFCLPKGSIKAAVDDKAPRKKLEFSLDGWCQVCIDHEKIINEIKIKKTDPYKINKSYIEFRHAETERSALLPRTPRSVVRTHSLQRH